MCPKHVFWNLVFHNLVFETSFLKHNLQNMLHMTFSYARTSHCMMMALSSTCCFLKMNPSKRFNLTWWWSIFITLYKTWKIKGWDVGFHVLVHFFLAPFKSKMALLCNSLLNCENGHANALRKRECVEESLFSGTWKPLKKACGIKNTLVLPHNEKIH
jgi:hypothetical protein